MINTFWSTWRTARQCIILNKITSVHILLITLRNFLCRLRRPVKRHVPTSGIMMITENYSDHRSSNNTWRSASFLALPCVPATTVRRTGRQKNCWLVGWLVGWLVCRTHTRLVTPIYTYIYTYIYTHTQIGYKRPLRMSKSDQST